MGPSKTTQGNKEVELYFAFPDGVYHYVCAECTAICCKGHGLGGNQERMRPLFVKYPQIESMALRRVGSQIWFAAPSDGCVMLDTDNLCRIEKELGKDMKPNVCNLFPFNAFSKIGKTVTVSPNFLCPLRIAVPARPGEVLGTHAQLEAEIRKSETLDEDYVKSVLSSVLLPPSISASAALVAEKAFRDRCSEGLGKSRFSQVLAEASEDPKGLEAFVVRAARIMGLPPLKKSRKRDYVDDLLLAFAVPYRLRILRLGSEGMLRVLALAEVHLRHVLSGMTIAPTVQGVANTVATFIAAPLLLVHGDEPFDFGKVTKKTFSFNEPGLTFAAFIFVRQANRRSGVLGALEQSIPGSMSICDRSILLLHFGQQMEAIKARPSRRHGKVIDEILSSKIEPGKRALAPARV